MNLVQNYSLFYKNPIFKYKIIQFHNIFEYYSLVIVLI